MPKTELPILSVGQNRHTLVPVMNNILSFAIDRHPDKLAIPRPIREFRLDIQASQVVELFAGHVGARCS